MGVLTRIEMEQVLIQKGSVLHNGRIISRMQDLPSEAELAAGNPAQEAAVAGSLQAQITALQAQLSQLQPSAPPSDDGPPPPSDKTTSGKDKK
jgi:hypothetical protein